MITPEQFDALSEAYQASAGEDLTDRERAVLLALAKSRRARKIQLKRIEWVLEGVPQEAQDACLYVEAFEMGMRWAETEQLEGMAFLEAPPQ